MRGRRDGRVERTGGITAPSEHRLPRIRNGRRGRLGMALLAATCALAACGLPPPAHRSSAPGRCPAPFNAGSRLPGYADPAYPRSGLFPARGGYPPRGAPAVTLRVRARQLVATFGQPLERTATLHNKMVTGTASGSWETLSLPAGYTFQLFGPDVPILGVIPGPLLTGSRAAGLKYVWLVTQWTVVQPVTVLRGTEALAAATPDWRQVPPGVGAANMQRVADQIRAAEAAGWTPEGVYAASPACGTTADHLGPFGARASIRLPLGLPLRLIVPEYGSITLVVTDR